MRSGSPSISRNLGMKVFAFSGHPSPPVSVTAHSKGLTRGLSVSADPKGLICTKIVQNPRLLVSAHSKGLSYAQKGDGQEKSGSCLPLERRFTQRRLYFSRRRLSMENSRSG